MQCLPRACFRGNAPIRSSAPCSASRWGCVGFVESINAIGHRLGAITTAEHVEDAETLEIVRAMGIDQAQGYAVARPQPLDTVI
jgi:EAL domain-containing protein (putative c-di-GMP-specific phosphodiesterase class I)